jgi:3',5'-cyclic AMP phosphodiesterase CpdA
MTTLLLALALSASAHDALFDGGRDALRRYPAAAVKPVAGAAVKAKPTAVPPDLAAAGPRVGNAAMLARVAPRSAPARFTFGVLGDSERGRFWWERIFTPGKTAFVEQWRALQATSPDFVLHLGDFVSEGDAAHYREHVAFVDAEVRTPLLRALGNHDRSRPNGDADKNLYDAVVGARDYFFDHAGWRFITVDSSDRGAGLTDAQLDWLERTLSVPGPKVVFTHVPPDYIKDVTPLAEVGALEEWSFDAAEQEEQKGYLRDFFTNYFEVGAKRFEDLVTRGGVKAVYMGHIHAFWAADHRGVRYVISGGGGSPLYPLPPGYPKKKFAHYLKVEATPAGLRETVVPLDGAPFVLPPVR